MNLQGNHSFQALKRIILQNDKIYPQATVIPQGGISVSQMLIGHHVNLQDKRILNRLYNNQHRRGPLRKRLGNRVRNEVNGRVHTQVNNNQAQINALTESKIKSKVVSTIDSQVSAKLNALAGKIQKSKNLITDRVSKAGINQRYKNYRSSETELITDALIGNAQQLGAGQSDQCQNNISDFSFSLHQSVFNNYYRTQDLGGKTISTSALREQIKKVFNTLSNKTSTENSSNEDSSGNWLLAKNDPLAIRLDGNNIVFELNTALKDEDDETPVYFNIIAPIRLNFDQQSLSLRLGHISISPVGANKLSRHKLVTKMQEVREAIEKNSLLASIDLNYEIWDVQNPGQKKRIYFLPQSQIKGEWICVYMNL